MAEQVKKKRKKRKKAYVNNKDLLEEIRLSHEQGRMTEKLGKMILMLATRFSKQPCFVGYTYIDDIISYAVLSVCANWHKFDPEKSNNPFSYYTECIKRAFYQYLIKEKKQRVIRDELLIINEMSPSHTYLAEYEQERKRKRLQELEMDEMDVVEIMSEDSIDDIEVATSDDQLVAINSSVDENDQELDIDDDIDDDIVKLEENDNV
jgi:DNA-directed RNA polymerase specialized sigma subunit